MAKNGFFSLRATGERQARIDELGRRIGSDSVATIIDHALGVALAHTPKQEAQMEPTFKTFDEAYAAGYRRASRTDRDTSGPNSFGYSFENEAGERTVTVSLTQEHNKIGGLGCYVPMYPPTVE